jgi:site-specific recombinase XerD
VRGRAACRRFPPRRAAIAAFLASEADRGFRPVTVGRRATAIAAAHRAQDHPNPCDSGAVDQILSGIRRRHGTPPERRAAPLDLSPLEQVLAELDTSTLTGMRDRALLLLGFAAALRRSELVALDVEHLEFTTARGLLVRIALSKTDQERAGATVAVPYARAGNN